MLKIAFLFMTFTNVYHEQHWRDFFKGHEHKYSIYVHAKEDMPRESWFYQYTLPYKIPNTWSLTMRMQIGMLKEALKDPDNAIFIYVSHNTIPLQHFSTIYDQLISANKSMFWYERNPHTDPSNPYYPARDLQPIPKEYQYKNAQWTILNRKHAQMMVDDTEIIAIASSKASDQELYPATFLALHNELHNVLRIDATLIVWHLSKRPPYVFRDLNVHEEFQLLTDAIIHGIYFARKIDEECLNLDRLDPYLSYRNPVVRYPA